MLFRSQFRDLPVIVDECDPCVPAHFSAYDNANFGFRNTPYYGSVMASVFKRILDLNDSERDAPDVTLASAWAFYFEGERYFEGFREFFTADNVELPVLNAYRALAKLHDDRVALSSDATWLISEVDRLATDVMDPATGSLDDLEVDGIATRTKKSVRAVLWHHRDDQYAAAPDAQVTVAVAGLPFGADKVSVRQVRIDRTHSNAHAVWEAMGRPQHPTTAQLAELHAKDGLEEGHVIETRAVGENSIELSITMPLHSISLLEITPAE